MTLKKRGLGRGLEALLVDVAAGEDRQPADASQQRGRHLSSDAMNADDSRKTADPEPLALIETLKQENLMLLQEVAVLRQLLDEFETMVRHY